MKSGVGTIAKNGKLARIILIAAAMGTVSLVGAGAQELTDFTRSGTYFIDGSTPVDARTRDLVDTYMAQRRTRAMEEAARRANIKAFEYHGNTVFDQQFGRF